MKYLWLFAHPEARSFNAALRDEGVAELRRLGHEVRQSDLYAQGWNPVVDAADFGSHDGGRMFVGQAQESAYLDGTLSPDIRAEQDKLEWADILIVQFPLWWFGMPAIMKGWFDRVFTQGFAFGLRDEQTGRVRQYGDGGLAGKRAMVVTSYGSGESAMSPRGIHGDINEILFPIHHGILWYTGISVVPPFAVGEAHHPTSPDFRLAAKRLRRRLAAVPEEEPFPFRYKDRGDFGPGLVLRDELAMGASGLAVHYRDWGR